MAVKCGIKYLQNYNKDEWGILKQGHEYDAGFDLRAAIPGVIRLGSIFPAEIPTGIAVEIPPGYELQIRPRGGASKEGLIIINSPGTVDAGYRGEIIVLAVAREMGLRINPGERIAQAVVSIVPQIEWIEKDELSPSERGEGKLGSTGRM